MDANISRAWTVRSYGLSPWAPNSASPTARCLFVFEERKRDAIAHHRITLVIGMQMAAAFQRRPQMRRSRGIAQEGIEVNDAVEGTGADEIIHGLPVCFSLRRIVG